MSTSGALRRNAVCTEQWQDGLFPFPYQEDANLRTRLAGNPVFIDYPEDILSDCCTLPPIGRAYAEGGASNVFVFTTGATAGNGGANLTYRYEFTRPVDVQISMGSMAVGAGETMTLLSGCDEFVAGAGSNLATNPSGYPAGTVYHDNNGGASQAIWRDVTLIRLRVSTNSSLTCGMHPSFLRVPLGCLPPVCS